MTQSNEVDQEEFNRRKSEHYAQTEIPRQHRRKREAYLKRNNVSPKCNFSQYDDAVRKAMTIAEAKNESMMAVYRPTAWKLTNYPYWFFLSVLWTKDRTMATIEEWNEFFNADRPDRDICIMKPTELKVFKFLPKKVLAYCIRGLHFFTLSKELAVIQGKFTEQESYELLTVEIDRASVLAYFSRNGEEEIVCFNDTAGAIVKTERMYNGPREADTGKAK